MGLDKRLTLLEQRYVPKGARLETPFLRELCIESGGDPDNYFSPLAGMSDKESGFNESNIIGVNWWT